jgi:hypothetical protein
VGRSVSVQRTEDRDLIRDLVLSVWDSIAEDGLTAESWEPNFYRRVYLCAYHGENPLAVMSAHPINASALQVHIHIPHENRELKYEIGQALIDYVWAEAGFSSLVAMIPVIFPNVEGFAKRLGFVNVGALKRAHKKDGELHDVNVLQLEKGE